MKAPLLPQPAAAVRTSRARLVRRIAALLLLAGMLLAALSINRRQLEPQHHPLQPHYYSAALRPLRRYLADHPDDMLAPLLSQLERSPPASVEDARQVYAAALERLTW
jgi:hypothetical protein